MLAGTRHGYLAILASTIEALRIAFGIGVHIRWNDFTGIMYIRQLKSIHFSKTLPRACLYYIVDFGASVREQLYTI
jgi:hypothetical protein